MRTSLKGLIFIVGHEGVVPAPYKDSVNVWTFGIGHTKAAGDPDPSKMARGMPGDSGLQDVIIEAFDLFIKDIRSYEDAVNRAVNVDLEQHEFDALVSFHYNTGGIGRAKATKLLNQGKRKEAAEALMNWKRPPEILDRRKTERDLFLTGEYSTQRATVWRTNGNGTIQWSDPVKQLGPTEIAKLLQRGDNQPPGSAPVGDSEGDDTGDTKTVTTRKSPVDKIIALIAALIAGAVAIWQGFF